ncbi:hypothetical protein M9Y10_037796 [Tritrichomonas musculus]|uniref:Uncharacterized protein n=1 Tax=Tritrichomonas musculus TaxID=1915356 RepID=A0ABR2GRF9_9EUKA
MTLIELNRDKENLSLKQIDPISQSIDAINYIYGNKIYAYSMKPDEKIELSKEHCVFNGYVTAFKEHRPITISPDIFWLLIIQGFANHVNNNAEKLRSMFVNFEGKRELTVKREDMTPQTAKEEDWNGIFSEFVDQIKTYTGEEITETLEPKFTTTTNVTKAVGQLSIMCAMKKYFSYHVIMCICHFPYIIIEGSTADWQQIIEKLEKLRKFDLDDWVNELTPILTKIVESKEGKVDKEFWNNMIHIQPSRGAYRPGYVDGWFVKFFLYNIYGKRVCGKVSDNDDDLTSEMLTIPFKLTFMDKTTDCEFVAGFVGTSQDPETRSIKPEIGWIIREEDKEKKKREAEAIEKKRKEAKSHGHVVIKESV